MDTQVTTLNTDNFAALAAQMGQDFSSSTSVSTANTLVRLRIMHSAIMGTVNQDGKQRKMEVVPGGTFRADDGTGNYAYAESVTLRPFKQSFSYRRYIPYAKKDAQGRKGKFVKTVMTSDYSQFNNNDVMDDSGGFNCGRPSGYIKDWKALPDDQKQLIKSVKRVRAIFGEATFNNAVDAAGEAIDTNGPIPVIWEIDNNNAFKIMGEGLQKYSSAKRMFPQHSMEITTTGSPMANGNMLYMPEPTLDLTQIIELDEEKDGATLQMFLTWVENYNKYVSESHTKNSPNGGFSNAETETIESFIEVDA